MLLIFYLRYLLWKSGKILGMKARGNYEVDIEWENTQLKKAAIRSYNGEVPAVTVAGKSININTDPRVSFTMVAAKK